MSKTWFVQVKVTCPRCDGEGKYLINDEELTPVIVDCALCDGHGEVWHNFRHTRKNEVLPVRTFESSRDATNYMITVIPHGTRARVMSRI